ncbi:hypothetical protein P872_02025 [Rhodonellum psychrophilum GCM71 = DSM 17998]|uniref:Uncharacterized protein n=1 Tax=Rhodonellum psychrophilum GCM71 = DSM 17998 TaxID=1123057 RepID=U5C6J5_9BACT|nr:hypothetical protein P872_02025 [Rhodonellum psychrophilum GCM71 = DSM 17998]
MNPLHLWKYLNCLKILDNHRGEFEDQKPNEKLNANKRSKG